MNAANDTDQIPVNDTTRPDPRVVDFARASIRRNQRQQNERDAQGKPRRRPDDEPPEAA